MRSHPNTTVILVRHGRSTYNDQGRYQGRSDAAVLTESGRYSARQVGQLLKAQPVSAIYTSPLQRAQQTTHEIIQAFSSLAEVVVCPDLEEIHLPTWEGLTYQTVKQQFAETYACWQQRPHEFQLPQRLTAGSVALVPEPVFPVQDLYRRSQQFWSKLLPRHRGHTVLVVSHGGTNHALISTALDIAPQHHHSLQQSNCGVSILKFSGQGVQLEQLNQTAALGERLPKLKAGKQGLRLVLIPAEHIEHAAEALAARLAPISVDFCLSTDQPWTRRLLQNHPQALHLVTQNRDFLQDWQRTLTQSSRQASALMTGVAIAPRRSIQTLLMQTLGGSPHAHSKIILQPDRLSVIHYPHDHRPVVQAVNI